MAINLWQLWRQWHHCRHFRHSHHCCHCKSTTTSIIIFWLAPLSPMIKNRHCHQWNNWRHWNSKGPIHSGWWSYNESNASRQWRSPLGPMEHNYWRQRWLAPPLAPLTSQPSAPMEHPFVPLSASSMAPIAPLTKLFDPFYQLLYTVKSQSTWW